MRSEALYPTVNEGAASQETGQAQSMWLGLLLLISVALYTARYWLYWDRFVESTMDEAIWLPLAMRWNDPTIFTQDPFVPVALPFFPVAYTGFVAAMLTVWSDPGMVLLVSSSALLAIYALGVYWLGCIVLEHRVAAFLIALVSLRVNVDLSGTGWGIFLGNAMPRAFFFAAAPWVLGLFLQRVHSASPLVWVGLIVGVVGNIHPLSALHLYLMMAGALALTPGPEHRLKRLCSLTGGFAVGIVPYLFQWVQLRDVTPLRMEILRFRAEVQSFPDWDVLVQRLLFSFLPASCMALGGWVLIRSTEDRLRAWGIARLGLIALIGTILGPLMTWLVPRLFAIHLLRMSGYLFLLFLILTGFLVRDLLRRGTWMTMVVGYGVAVLLFLSAGGGRAGEVAQWASAVISSERRAVLGADVGPGENRELDKQAFLDLCNWARSYTDRDALFLMPPDRFASFRIYAQRALLVTFKDGAVTVFSGHLAEDWYARYREAERLYDSFQPDSVTAFSGRYAVHYAVQETMHAAIDLPVVYENHRYRVYNVAVAKRT
jgi:hypothetical protein